MSTEAKLKYLSRIPSVEIDAMRKTFPKGVVVFDLETTGLSPLVDKIIEIGAIKVLPNSVDCFSTLVNPEIKIPESTIKIHGITNLMVENSGIIEEHLPDFMEFIENLPLVAHNAKFDIGFIVINLNKFNIEVPDSNVYCSCQYSRSVFPESKNYKLTTLATTFEIEAEQSHRATDDAIVCLRVMSKGLIKNNYSVDKFILCNLSNYRKDKVVFPDHLKILPEKTAKQEDIEIMYSGGSMKGTFRPIRPTSLLPAPNGNILYALCLISNQYKSFAISKIKKVREIKEDDD